MQTVTYERVSPKDFQPGDVVHHNTWILSKLNTEPYRIIENTDNKIRCTLGKGQYVYNYTPDAFGENQYHNDWWVREIHELQYDPNQQGDTEDDI